jgi:DNA-binding transcriptional LysR family regulator
MHYTLPQLRAFVALAENGSFTRAAIRLNLSQPALTVQIRNLEAAFGAKLFDRDPRGVVLTRVGSDLAPPIKRLLREMDHALEEAVDTAVGLRGTIRIAALPSFASGRLPQAIVRYRKSHPAIGFVIRDAVASKATAAVLAGAVDLGLIAQVEMTNDLDVLHEATDRLCLVAPASHPLVRKRRISLEDVAKYPLVLMESDTSVRALVDAAFISAGRLVRPAAEATYMMTAVALVRAGLGATILPEFAKEIDAEPSLRALKISDPRFSRRIALVKRRNRSLSRAAEDFIPELVAAMKPGVSRDALHSREKRAQSA